MNTLIKNALLMPFDFFYRINPQKELSLMFRLKQGYWMDMQHPVTYNEKIQWIKLNDRNALMPVCSDKFAVRSYVEQKGCGKLLNQLYWEGDNPELIPFDLLPSKFVIKVTHGSTFNVICKDKSKLNRKKIIHLCKRWLKTKFLPCYGEWFYGEVKPRVIIEKYLETEDQNLKDYKVYCFGGTPRYISVDSGRGSKNHTKNIYDTNWKLQRDYQMGYPCTNIPEPKPDVLEKLLLYAKILSEDFLHARIDFYIIENHIIFGEISFTNSAGFGNVSPKEFDIKMGNYLYLPIENSNILWEN